MFKRISFRIYQWLIAVTTRLLSFGEPDKITGEDCLGRLGESLEQHGVRKVFIVTDEGIEQAGIMDSVTDELNHAGIPYATFNQIKPNPTVELIEKGLAMYRLEEADALLAVGGGSVIDAAKLIGARAIQPKKSLHKMRGLLKVRRDTPLLIAVPTTAGTGSETTVAAVVRDSQTHEKYAINDPHLLPDIAILDPLLSKNLPRTITAATGMDALTHAIEAYLNRHNTRETKKRALNAINIIFTHLPVAFKDPTNLRARTKMLEAAYDAGYAFTRAFIGNVHAMSHQLSGMYDLPHGHVNAVILPYVLDHYGSSIDHDMAMIYDHLHDMDNPMDEHDKNKALVADIRSLNQTLGMPESIDVIRTVDINQLAKQAYREANPLYPVPVMFEIIDFIQLYMQLMPAKKTP